MKPRDPGFRISWLPFATVTRVAGTEWKLATAQVVFGTGPQTELRTTVTPADGVSRIRFQPPTIGAFTIRATSSQISSTKNFDVTETARIVIVAGDNQSGPVGQELPIPLKVRLTS